MDDTKWVICPNCKSKTRLKLLPETVLERFPLLVIDLSKKLCAGSNEDETCTEKK